MPFKIAKSAPLEGRLPLNWPTMKESHFFWFLSITSFGILTHHSPDSSWKGVPFLLILLEQPFAMSLQEGLAAEVTSPTGNTGEGDSLLEADYAGSERPTLEPTCWSSGVPWEVAGGADDDGRTGGVDIRSSTADSGGGAERD